jgi:ribosome biogenesis GTPase
LTDIDSLNEWADLYKNIGYEVFITSVIAQTGISRVKDKLAGKKNLFWGQSGVGKSSLLNSLYTDLKFKIGEISDYTSKGVHTTVTSNMIYVGDNTYIIDTPGVREIDPYGIRKEDLGHYFIDFERFINKCKFNTCTHHHEPGCAVIKALKNGDIYTERYDSYLRILETVEEDINF